MKCVICHGESIVLTKVREELTIGNNVVYVPVELLVCQTCGERYYDRRTMRFLEDAERQLKEGSAELEELGKVLLYTHHLDQQERFQREDIAWVLQQKEG